LYRNTESLLYPSVDEDGGSLFVCNKLSQVLTNRSPTTTRRSRDLTLTFNKGFGLLNLGSLEDQQQANVFKLDNGGISHRTNSSEPSTACFNQGIMLAG
jgi:hypothetical protein